MKSSPKKYGPFFTHLSIQRRLPLFTCILLLFVVFTYSLTSYIGVRKAALQVGTERLQTLAGQFASMLQQSMQALTKATQAAAKHDAVKKYMLSKDTASKTAALKELSNTGKDTAIVQVLLLDTAGTILISGGKENINLDIHSDPSWKTVHGIHDSAAVGKLHSVKAAVYYPTIAPVTDDHGGLTGYLVRWRILTTSPKALAQWSQLIGSGASLFFGNTDGSLWTDAIQPTVKLPVDSLASGKIVRYRKPTGQEVFALARPIPGTWIVILIEFSTQKMTEAASRFLFWDIMIGIVLIVIGISATWWISRGIIRPLNQLTTATSAFAEGNYLPEVQIDREDEVGMLARTFNSMVKQVHGVQEDLERKVKERTRELTGANQELEAFSYSVSHDLKSPLRAIKGYSAILKNEHGPQLDTAAVQLIDKIVSGTNRMEQLIEDLISFSIVGRKKAVFRQVDMYLLAEQAVAETLEHHPEIIYKISVGVMPACYGDPALLKQVWTNLVSNAVKYSSKESSPEIEIGSEETASVIIYHISDNGVGFSMDYASKLFNVFQRLHSQSEFEGTGIGLALVKNIISKHDGEVWAESVPGEGSTFYFSVPKHAVNR
ncbi:MAG: ATP-binding protein [Bacteroidota bacterium]